MLAILGTVLALFTVLATALSLARSRFWLVRIWDFPRVQVALVGVLALALGSAGGTWWEWPLATLVVLLIVAVAYQGVLVWRYTRLAPREVQESRADDPARRLSLVIANVLQPSREADRLLAVVRAADPDVVLCVETDDWWAARLDALTATHRHAVRCPLPNTYGMILFSRLPLEDPAVEFLVEKDVPSIQARVRLENGARVWLNCVHPRPPAPQERNDSLVRDAELLLVGRRVREAEVPVIVCGDLNDVAWSRTTRLFQKVSRLLDPRKGRGFYSTFPARLPGLRYPLDHVFHSASFRLVALRRLPYSGSDHFPVYIALSYEPDAAERQDAPRDDAGDHAEAAETIGDARGGDG